MKWLQMGIKLKSDGQFPRELATGGNVPVSFDEYLELNAEALDITRTMYQEATDHYQAVASFLGNNGIIARFYADGSFATGTVVRPFSEDDDAFFDLDVVGKRTDVEKSDTSPAEVRASFEDLLVSSDRYGGMLEPYDECLTLCYADGGFKLDVVPCVADDKLTPGDPIAIARKDASEWLPSNPKGLSDWFMAINSRFFAATSENYRRKVLESNRDAYATIDEVPDWLVRTSLQRAVQVLKRSRDVYCYHAEVEGLLPSCAIMVLTADIARGLDASLGIHDILSWVVDRLIREAEAGLKGVSGYLGTSGSWHVDEPITGNNLVDWTDENVHHFLRWLKGLRATLQLSPVRDAAKFNAGLKRVFGNRAKTVPDKAFTPASIVMPTRPWAW